MIYQGKPQYIASIPQLDWSGCFKEITECISNLLREVPIQLVGFIFNQAQADMPGFL